MKPMPSAEVIAEALGARRVGGAWVARCPAHDDREPSLSIKEANDGKVLVRCHAQCEQGVVISARRARGLWGAAAADRGTAVAGEDRKATGSERSRAERTEAALAIWSDGKPAVGSLVEYYLAARGLHL